MSFEIQQLLHSTIWQLYRTRDRIDHDPPYQRQSDIWTLEKRQLLIDTILNRFDIPKLYLHKFPKPKKIGGKVCDYAIIDGKQRLETIWAFIEGRIALDGEAVYFKNDNIKYGGMTYEELAKNYPDLKADFDGFPLSVMLIETDDIEMIEEMFSRLNEALPLAAAEKRNAFHGPLPIIIRKLAKDAFFTDSIPFENKRYRHFDLAAKFLFAESEQKVVDTKKRYLDDFVRRFENLSKTTVPKFVSETYKTIKLMNKVFTKDDTLLHQVGMVMLYYHLFRIARREKWTGEIARKRLLDFDKLRATNRATAENNVTKADYELLEFDRYAQSPNDALAIKFRLKVLLEKAFNRKVATDDL